MFRYQADEFGGGVVGTDMTRNHIPMYQCGSKVLKFVVISYGLKNQKEITKTATHN